MVQTFRQLLADDSGATAIEYGLIAALVSIGSVAAMSSLGTSLNDMFGFVSAQLVVPEAVDPQCVESDSSCKQ
jgi:pilus assembly protein Flp/PilA